MNVMRWALVSSILLVCSLVPGPVEGWWPDGEQASSDPRVVRLSQRVYRTYSANDMNLPIYDIRDVHVFPGSADRPELRLVVQDGFFSATDFGPYRGVFLVVFFGREMPAFRTVIPIGSWGSIDEVQRQSASVLTISGSVYQIGHSVYGYGYETVDVLVDLSALLAELVDLDQLTSDNWDLALDKEGPFPSYADILVRGATLLTDNWP